MVIKYLIEKEFKQMLRNSFLPRMIIIFPVMIMALMPWAASLEIHNVNLDVIDNDHSPLSQRLLHKMEASDYFHLQNIPASYNEAMKDIERGNADLIVEIPRHFERNFVRNQGQSQTLISANAVNATKAGLGSAYLSSIINHYGEELSVQNRQGKPSIMPAIQISSLDLYNSNLSYKLFMVPALVVVLLTLLCGFLPALNVVSEKETGTIEQINVTPISKATFILAKLLPYWLIGFIVLNLCFFLAWVLYGIIPVGSLGLVYLASATFVLAMSGLGLVISTHSATMQQAMFVMWFCMMIFMLMSGIFTPVHSMPQWAQYIADANPLKYYVKMMRMIYLKGSTFTDLQPELIVLTGFAILFNAIAIRGYRKES